MQQQSHERNLITVLRARTYCNNIRNQLEFDEISLAVPLPSVITQISHHRLKYFKLRNDFPIYNIPIYEKFGNVLAPTAPKMVHKSNFNTISWTLVANEMKKKIQRHPMRRPTEEC
uniref:Uncharacterized protein n=1 Tax=Romanomermis culicivorax TaxID=13658 RepID=A0A915L727_ROMCU